MADDLYRVVVDGIGRLRGTAASRPAGRKHTQDKFDHACAVFAGDIATGRIRISVLAEAEYRRRSPSIQPPRKPESSRWTQRSIGS